MTWSNEEDDLSSRVTRVGLLLEPGLQIGPYRLDKRLGKGGMGEVWRAIDPTRGDPGWVALKFLPLELQGSPREMRRAFQTFEAVQALQHTNICPVYQLIKEGRYGPVLVMKYISGISLLDYRDAYVEQHGQFSVSQVQRVLAPVAAALDYAHRPWTIHPKLTKSVIHRDIKPENILISEDGVEIQIVDFGLAAQVRMSMMTVSKVEMDSTGTRPYMAPEQWLGQAQDARTDQYALAVVAYELLADRHPFEINDTVQLRECVLNVPTPPIESVNAQVNQALRKAMSKLREDRFESCSQFIEALGQQSSKPATTAKKLSESSEPVGSNKRASELLVRGKGKSEMGDFPGAMADYDEAIRLNPKYAAAYYGRGIAKRNLQDYAGAVADYDEAIRLNPKYAAAYYGRGIAKHNLQDYAGALADYDEAVRLNPKYAAAYNNRGIAKHNLKDYAGAMADYDEAIRLDPKYAAAYYGRGIAKHNLQDYAGALADYDDAIRLDPKDAIAYNNRGIAKRNLQDYAGAIADYDEAIRLDPKMQQHTTIAESPSIT